MATKRTPRAKVSRRRGAAANAPVVRNEGETDEQHEARVAAAEAEQEQLENNPEYQKATGQTDSQQQIRDYHEGDFQDTDPVTGEPRGPMHPYADTARIERAGREEAEE